MIGTQTLRRRFQEAVVVLSLSLSLSPSAALAQATPAPAAPAPAVAAPAASGNLLRNAQLRRADKVQNPSRMTDGVVPSDGDDWNTDLTAILAPGGVAEWDLGSVRTVRGARIIADNNEPYFVDVSEDGNTFVPLWKAEDVAGAGLRTRQIAPIEAQARYVRVHAEGGDDLYSVGELELFASAAEVDSPGPTRVAPKPPEPQSGCNSTWLAVVGAAVLVFLFLRRKAPPEQQAAAPADAEPPKSDEPDEPEKKG